LNDWRGTLSVCTASLFLHGLIFLVVSLIPPEDPPWKKKAVAIVTRIEPEEVVVLDETPVAMPELKEVKVDEPNDPEIRLETSEESVDLEELAVVEDEPAKEDLEAEDLAQWSLGMEDSAAMQEGFGLAELALNQLSGSDGIPTTYKGRASKEDQKKLIRNHGGAPKVLDAVSLALRWLAAHQEPDGSWPLLKGENLAHKDEKEKGPPAKKVSEITVAITGTAVLAFLGAGHSETMGQYQPTVRKGIKFLNRYLLDHPGELFGKTYGASIVLMALAEASIFSSSPLSQKNANILAAKLMKVYEGEGWGYTGPGDDFSVSGWVALGLKSGRQADLVALGDEEIHELFLKYGKWVNTMTNPETGLGSYRPGGKGTMAMTWVGMFQKQFLGFPRDDPFLTKAAEISVLYVPKVFKAKSLDEYMIYYGTLAAFQQQGAFWKAWNPMMQEVLLSTQKDGPVETYGGSWNPSELHIGRDGGRVMSTAIFTLCLEVYYRYALMQ